MNKNAVALAFFALCFVPLAYSQGIYKCRTPGGQIEYRQIPCTVAQRHVDRLIPDAAPSPEERYAAEQRRQHQYERTRAREADEARAELEREKLALERRRLDEEERQRSWEREKETRNINGRLVTRSRAEWMAREKARAERSSRAVYCSFQGTSGWCD